MNPRWRVALAWLPAVAYMGLIWAISSLQVQVPVVTGYPLGDKGVHFTEYAVLGLLVTHAARRTWPDRRAWRIAGVGVLIAAAWGWLDELHQAFVPTRNAEVLDAVADTLGALAGAVLYLGIGALVASVGGRGGRRVG